MKLSAEQIKKKIIKQVIESGDATMKTNKKKSKAKNKSKNFQNENIKEESSPKQNIQTKQNKPQHDSEPKTVKSTQLQVSFPEGQPCYKKALQAVIDNCISVKCQRVIVLKMKNPEKAGDVFRKLKKSNGKVKEMDKYIPTKKLGYVSHGFKAEKVKQFFGAKSISPVSEGSSLQVLEFESKEEADAASCRSLMGPHGRIELHPFFTRRHRTYLNASKKRKREDEVPAKRVKTELKKDGDAEEDDESDDDDEEEVDEEEDEKDNEEEESDEDEDDEDEEEEDDDE